MANIGRCPLQLQYIVVLHLIYQFNAVKRLS